MTGRMLLHLGDSFPAADAAGSARRLQALIAIGHCEARLASLLRHYEALESEGDVARLLTPPGRARVTVSRGTHDAICRLYDDLWDQQPPEESPAERAAAAAARALARQRDWPTPAALDDDLIDDPAYQPDGDWLPGIVAGVPQRVLDTIEDELRVTDQQLAAAFAAFTRFASRTRTPRPERLTARHRLITRLRRWRIGGFHRTRRSHGTRTG